MNSVNVKKIAASGLMAALVFAASWLQIPLAESARVHLGNVMCILSGLLLGGYSGGCSAGIGSALFDLTNPLYYPSMPFTLVFKFFIGFLSGTISHSGGRKGKSTAANIIGSVCGSLTYIVLYLSKNYVESRVIKLLDHNAALIAITPKAVTSLINGSIAVVVAIPLAAAIRAAMNRFRTVI